MIESGLPSTGARVPLVVAGRTIGWLDLWGTGAPASPEERRLLADFARHLALMLAGANPALWAWSPRHEAAPEV